MEMSYLTKPIRRELLQKEIARVTNHGKQESEAPLTPVNTPAVSGWNMSELLDRLDDDRDFLCDLLRVFREDSQTNVQRAKKALAEGDLAGVARAAHTLKGMLRSLSMNRAAEKASELENASRQEKGEEAESLLAQLAQALAELSPEVDAQLAEVKA